MSKTKRFLILLAASCLAYGTSLRYGFSQDDWFHLTISHADNLRDVLNFFNPFGVHWIFFRPLSTQVPYWLASSFFSLTTAPIVMHLTMLLLQSLNAYLVVGISEKYLHKKLAVVLGIFYAISNVHFLSLFYIGAIQQLLSTSFTLLAIKSFVQRSRPHQGVLALWTLAALLSKELALRLPLLLFIMSYAKNRHLRQTLSEVSGPVIVTILYLLLRLVSRTTGATEYAISLSPMTTLATAMWYGLFSLGFPEYLLRFGESHGLVNFVAFFREDPLKRLPIFVGAGTMGIMLVIRAIRGRQFIFSLLALTSLLPVLFLPTHRYPHYLDLALLYMGIWLLHGVSRVSGKILLPAAVIAIGMYSSIQVEEQTHWTVQRAMIAKFEMQAIEASGDCQKQDGITILPTNSVSSLEISYALSLENGPRVICHNPHLPVYYSGITP